MNTQKDQSLDIQKECLRAVDGEKMWILLNHVKPDRREEFERFVHVIIKQIAVRTEPYVLNRTRILHPTGPNEDGTYPYIFLVDPFVPDGVYDINTLLSQAYPPGEIEEIIKLFTESLATPQIGYEITQVPW